MLKNHNKTDLEPPDRCNKKIKESKFQTITGNKLRKTGELKIMPNFCRYLF